MGYAIKLTGLAHPVAGSGGESLAHDHPTHSLALDSLLPRNTIAHGTLMKSDTHLQIMPDRPYACTVSNIVVLRGTSSKRSWSRTLRLDMARVLGKALISAPSDHLGFPCKVVKPWPPPNMPRALPLSRHCPCPLPRCLRPALSSHHQHPPGRQSFDEVQG